MEYSLDELEAPEWLNEDFLKNIVKNSESNQNVKLIEYKITPAVTKGNHFASIMFRANVTYSILCDNNNNNNCNGDKKSNVNNINNIKNDSYIIKAMPEVDGFKKDLIKETPAFENEIKMYSKTIPYFENILKQNNINLELGARMLYSTRDKHEIIVFNDLKKLDYVLCEEGWLDIDDYKLVLKKLAVWHAVSYKINYENDSSIVQHYTNRGVMNVFDVENNAVFKSGLNSFEKLLNTNSDLNKYLKNYHNVKNIVLRECERSHSADIKNKFNVLNHGDFHMRNMMFKRDINTGKFFDVIFVDFQFCVWGSPAIDLVYSLYMMANPEIRYSKRNEIIYYYYNCFIDVLKQLKFNGYVPTYEDLQTELIKMKKYELFIFMAFTPYLHQMAAGVKLGEEALGDEDEAFKFFTSIDYVNDVKKMFPYFMYNGYFFNYDK